MNTSKLKTIFTAAVTVALMAAPLSATPEISFDGAFGIKGTKVKETKTDISPQLRTVISSEVADGVNANAILDIGHKNALSQATLTFDNIIDTVFGVAGSEMFNFTTTVGKQAIDFGSEGSLYEFQTQFIDKSYAVKKVTGEEVRTGDGVTFGFELPTPAPVNLSVSALESDNGNDNGNSISGRPTLALRTTTELEAGLTNINIGLSGIKNSDSKYTALGMDLGLTMDAFSAGIEVSQVEDKTNKADKFYAATLGYEINDEWSVATRYTGTKKHEDKLNGGKDEKALSLLATKQISDTMKLQLQYNAYTDVEEDGSTSTKDNDFQARFVVNLR